MLSDLLAHGHDIRSFPRASGELAVRLQAAGYEERRNEVYAWDGQKRGTVPFLVVQHSLVGEGRLDYAGVRHRLVPGTTMLVTMPHAHRYWLERGGHWEYVWFLISGSEAMRLARVILEKAGPVLRPDEAGVEALAAACHRVLASPTLTPEEASVQGYAALCSLHRVAFAEGALGPSGGSARMDRVAQHVEGNIGSHLRVEELARVAGMSRAHFVRCFTEERGIAPSDYVFERRMDRAERLLLATELKVAEIAKATGFAEPNYFSKCFRRHRGMAPLAFRQTREGAI